MRRPRHKLQVSTFPFLAVLLGAMGSLIFLLLVMDRRAKLAARNKAREAHETRLAQLSEADRARQEDWERQRRELHETLAETDRTLRDQLNAVQGELRHSSQQIETEADQQRRLQALVETEQAKLAKTREALRERHAVLLQSTPLQETSKAELARLTRDLLQLEETLDNLKRWKKQQQPAYSLVPYAGQRGAERVPIYVECTHAGLMFLPDGARLTGGDRDIGPFREEVEKRHGPLVKAAKRSDPFQPDPAALRPYVLFLIRPNGIDSFYRGQNALRGFEIDFGYELVDAEWTLNVPTEPTSALAMQNQPEQRPAVPRPPKATVGFVAGSAPVGQDSAPVRSGQDRGVGQIGLERGPGQNGQERSPGLTGQERSPVLRFETVAKSGGKGDAKPTLTFRRAQSKVPASLPERTSPGVKVPGQVANDTGQAGEGSNEKRQAAEQAAENDPGQRSKSDDETGQERSALAKLATPALTPDKQMRASPASLGRVIGNRDFIITLACYSEGVIVTPGGKSFTWKGTRDAPTDEAMVRAVSQLVTSRQATVRTGEPPYRVVLRFLVNEQGRRTYHRVYPLLENFRYAMVREDVEE